MGASAKSPVQFIHLAEFLPPTGLLLLRSIVGHCCVFPVLVKLQGGVRIVNFIVQLSRLRAEMQHQGDACPLISQ